MQLVFPNQGADEFIKLLGDFISSSPELHQGETLLQLPSHIGEGYMKKISLRPGLDILIESLMFKEHVVFHTEHTEQSSNFEISFYVSGGNTALVQGNGRKIEFSPGACGLGIPHRAQGRMEYSAEQRNVFITLYGDYSTLSNFVNGQLKILPGSLQKNILGYDRSFFFRSCPITPSMKLVTEQILNCCYEGSIQQLYLEGKALEIIALYLQQLILNTQDIKKYPTLCSDDIDRIHYAKDILLKNLLNPPSLSELSREIGFNDFKLKWGFRKVFGTTVFGYLNEYRLAKAKTLLEQDKLPISKVANAVGFTNHSHFSAIFKRKYGITPRAYLIEIRSNRFPLV